MNFSIITRTRHPRFDYFTDLPISYIFFDYNTDFAIFAYLWDWSFEDLSVPPWGGDEYGTLVTKWHMRKLGG